MKTKINRSRKRKPGSQTPSEAPVAPARRKAPAETEVKVEPAQRSDLAQLAELLHLLFLQECDFKPDSKKQRRALGMLLDSPSAAVFVARKGERIIGMVSLLFTISTSEGGAACWLEDMVVLPAYRHFGVGSQLLKRAVAEARSRGATRITLLTDRINGSAQRFYESHGFRPSPMVPLRLKMGGSRRKR